MLRVWLPRLSAQAKITPNTISMMAVSSRVRNVVSIKSRSSSPSAQIGMVPKITSQATLASTLSASRPQARQAAPPGQQHPHYIAAKVNQHRQLGAQLGNGGEGRPGSPPPATAAPGCAKCALEEMGRNSVRPCTSPNTRASTQPNAAYITTSAFRIHQRQIPPHQRARKRGPSVAMPPSGRGWMA